MKAQNSVLEAMTPGGQLSSVRLQCANREKRQMTQLRGEARGLTDQVRALRTVPGDKRGLYCSKSKGDIARPVI